MQAPCGRRRVIIAADKDVPLDRFAGKRLVTSGVGPGIATDAVPHGGLIVALLGAVGNVVGYVIAIAAGTLVTTVLVVALKWRAEHAGTADDEVAATA